MSEEAIAQSAALGKLLPGEAGEAALPAPRRTRRRGFGGGLARYVLRRALQSLLTVALIVLATFALLHLAPGDIVQVIAGEAGGGNPEYLAEVRRLYGLDDPLPVQFARYAVEVARFNLGNSLRYQVPVAGLIGAALPATLLLTLAAQLVACGVGITGGVVAALRPGSWLDALIENGSLVFYATPSFLLGIGLIFLFSITLGWLPINGMVDLKSGGDPLATALSVARHLVLPATTLGLIYGAIYLRFTRNAMIEVGASEYILTARAKGLGRGRIIWRHRLRNALLPVVTLIGMQAGGMIGGAVLVETVFAWPGIGRLAIQAVMQRDFTLLSGIILFSATLVVTINLLVDIAYTLLDPRIRLR